MTDIAELPGIRRVLFSVRGVDVPSYGAFVALGLAAGLILWWRERERGEGERSFWVLLAAVLGGAAGAKLPILVLHFREVAATGGASLLASGRSIAGGLVGGMAAVWGAKKALGIRERKGNVFALPVAVGVAIGRIGCFLTGCCAGTPTSVPWAVDFGDGVRRHPTQVYEGLFMAAMAAVLIALRRRPARPGARFRLLMVGYFSFRFLVEFVRAGEGPVGGLTFYQWVSLAVLAWYARSLPAAWIRSRRARPPGGDPDPRPAGAGEGARASSPAGVSRTGF